MRLIGRQRLRKTNILDSVQGLLLFSFLLIFSIAPYASANQSLIGDSVSPYVAMHEGDLVEWKSWDSSLLSQAKKEKQLIFLSIGYFSCYWCHVLQRESFNNPKVAGYINKHFISTVVDREVHVALDAKLTSFAEHTIGRSGWPLNVILTPDGYPLMAAIYYPPDQFHAWLKKVIGLWETDPDYIRGIAKDAANDLGYRMKPSSNQLDGKLARDVLNQFVREIKSSRDEFNGGFGDQSKFPLPAILNAVLQAYELTNDTVLKEVIASSLDQMKSKGLRDHLQEGFFRYTTDPDWLIPHFEKMLYDNAQLISLYMRAGKALNRPDWISVGESTLMFVVEEFKSIEGGYYSSFSAVDETGEEGGYYVWQSEQWQKLLDEKENDFVNKLWGWGNPPMIEQGYYPVYLDNEAGFDENAIKLSVISKLRKARDKRVLPIDKKILFSWNALLLQAFIDAFEITGNNQYKKYSHELAAFLQAKLEANSSSKGIYNEEFVGHADLQDYAFLANALIKYANLFESSEAYKISVKLIEAAWSKYFGDFGWSLTDKLIVPLTQSETIIADGPLPSASASLIEASMLSGKPHLISKAKGALKLGHNYLKSQAFWYASQALLLQNNKIYAKE